jgi:hypothetical protein
MGTSPLRDGSGAAISRAAWPENVDPFEDTTTPAERAEAARLYDAERARVHTLRAREAASGSAPKPDEPNARTNGQQPRNDAASVVRQVARTRPGQKPTLAVEDDILRTFLIDLRRTGVAGEEGLAQLEYLALTSRVLPWGRAGERPISLLAKGTTSTGKSFTTSSVLRFFPPEAWIDLGSMSRRYLFYTDEDFRHRFIVVPEWASISKDEEIVAMLRVLLSEGRLVHGTVEGEGRRTARRIEKEGPTGLIITTTEAAVDPELETRCLSLMTDDSPEQTRRVFAATAAQEFSDDEVDFERWHDLQLWIGEHGESRVLVPFVHALAELMPASATRLRRDFVSLLCLVRAHAILYQAQRERDAGGRIVATVEDDYRPVRELVGDVIAEAVEASVTDATRATVEAVLTILNEGNAHASPKAVTDRLGIGRSAAYDRIRRALLKGYLVNEAVKDERGMKLVVGSPLPGTEAFLPSPADVVRVMSGSAPGQEGWHELRESEVSSGGPARPVDLYERDHELARRESEDEWWPASPADEALAERIHAERLNELLPAIERNPL